MDESKAIRNCEAEVVLTRLPNVVDLSPNLIAWPLPYKKANGPILPPDCRRMRERLCQAVRVSWKSNGMRHSFASYHLAMHQDSPRTALALGHSNPALVFRHYRELVTQKQAHEYFGLIPPTKAFILLCVPVSAKSGGGSSCPNHPSYAAWL
jgi:hypothetical protein